MLFNFQMYRICVMLVAYVGFLELKHDLHKNQNLFFPPMLPNLIGWKQKWFEILWFSELRLLY